MFLHSLPYAISGTSDSGREFKAGKISVLGCFGPFSIAIKDLMRANVKRKGAYLTCNFCGSKGMVPASAQLRWGPHGQQCYHVQ